MVKDHIEEGAIAGQRAAGARDHGRAKSNRQRAAQAAAAVQNLSTRQKQVLHLLISGLSYRDIGERLGIALRTAEMHVGLVRKALNVPSVTEAIRIGVEATFHRDDPFSDLRI
jgi:DNA-binding NarL/FixJ family response regulator